MSSISRAETSAELRGNYQQRGASALIVTSEGRQLVPAVVIRIRRGEGCRTTALRRTRGQWANEWRLAAPPRIEAIDGDRRERTVV